MKKPTKYSSSFLFVLLILNLLSWFFWGKERVLLTGSDISELQSWVPPIDTLYLFIGNVEDQYFLQFSDFKYSTIEQLVTDINSTNCTAIIDERPLSLKTGRDEGKELLSKSGSNAYSYDIVVEHVFPLIAEVDKQIWVPGFGTGTRGIYIWFFKWHYVVKTGGFIT